MTTATTPNIGEVLTQLRARLAALGDGRDAKSENERADWWSRHVATQGCISALMNLPDDLARAERRLADAVADRAETTAEQAELEQLVAAFTDWRLAGDARQRDQEYDRQRSVKLQLQLLRDGRLLAAPGVTFLAPAEAERRCAELTDRRERAQLALDGHLKQAEALLTAPRPVDSAADVLVKLADAFAVDDASTP